MNCYCCEESTKIVGSINDKCCLDCMYKPINKEEVECYACGDVPCVEPEDQLDIRYCKSCYEERERLQELEEERERLQELLEKNERLRKEWLKRFKELLEKNERLRPSHNNEDSNESK